MRFQRINKSDGDRIFRAAQNASTETLSRGYVMCAHTTATFAGNKLTKPSTANLNLMVGLCADSAVAVDAYFEVQTYGACTFGRIIQDTTAAGSVAVGDVLVPTNADWNLKLGGATAVGAVGLAVGAVAVATATVTAATASKAVWLRCM